MSPFEITTDPLSCMQSLRPDEPNGESPLGSPVVKPKRKWRNPLKNWKVLLSLLVLLFIGWQIISSHSKGSRVGKIVKFSKKGIFWKSYEGTLQVGDQASLTWDFSVQNGDVAQQVQHALELQQNVRLEYNEYYFNWSPADTLYDITKVTPVH